MPTCLFNQGAPLEGFDAVNVGVGGIGVVAATSVIGNSVRLKSIKSLAGSHVTVTDGGADNAVLLSVDVSSVDHATLLNSGTIAHAQIDVRLPSADEKAAFASAIPPTALNKFVTSAELTSATFQKVAVTSGDGADFLSAKISAGNGIAVATAGTSPTQSVAVSLLFSGSPADVDASAAAPGIAVTASRLDHKHNVLTASGVGIGYDGNQVGVSSALSRADHRHALRELGGQDLTLGVINSGGYLRRVGAAIVSETVNPLHVSVNSDDTSSAYLQQKLSSTSAALVFAPDPIVGSNPKTLQLTPVFGVAADTIAVGNDARFPTANEKAALTASLSPSAGNRYLTASELTTAKPLVYTDATDTTGGYLNDKLLVSSSFTASTAPPIGNRKTTLALNYTATAPSFANAASASPGDAGASAQPSRSDHVHRVITATATAIGQSNSPGTSTSLARADHDHRLKDSNSIEYTLGAFTNGQVLVVNTAANRIDSQASETTDRKVSLFGADSADILSNKLIFANGITLVDTSTTRTASVAYGLSANTAVEGNSTRILSLNERNALTAANAPSAGNPIATIADVPISGITTGANVGTLGGGEIFRDKVGNNINFKRLQSGTSTLAVGNGANDITISLIAANLSHGALDPASVGSNTHAQIDTHIANSAIHTSVGAIPPVGITPGTVSAVGTSLFAARQDHVHGVSASSAVATGGGNTEGVSSAVARADHTHALKIGAGSLPNANNLTFGNINNNELLVRVGDLIQSAPIVGTDQFVKVSALDTTAGYLGAKVLGGNPQIVITTQSPGANENLLVSANVTQDSTGLAAGNDSRFPTLLQKEALAGTDGAPSDTNRFVTNSDQRLLNHKVSAATADATNDYLENKIKASTTPFSYVTLTTQTGIGGAKYIEVAANVVNGGGAGTLVAGDDVRFTSGIAGLQYNRAEKTAQVSTTGAAVVANSIVMPGTLPNGLYRIVFSGFAQTSGPFVRPQVKLTIDTVTIGEVVNTYVAVSESQSVVIIGFTTMAGVAKNIDVLLERFAQAGAAGEVRISKSNLEFWRVA